MPLRQTYRSLLNRPLIAPVTSNTFTTTDLYVGTVAPLNPPIFIPPNYLQPGTLLKLSAFGTYTTATTPTLGFSVSLGATGTVTIASGVVRTLTAVGPLQWQWHSWHQVQKDGLIAAATVESWGFEMFTPTSLTTAPVVSNIPQVAEAAVAIDTTIQNTFCFRGIYSASAAGNIVVLRGFALEEITQM
jgi:hypothetical protein